MEFGLAFTALLSAGKVGASVFNIAQKVNSIRINPGKQEEVLFYLSHALETLPRPMIACAELAKRYATHDMVQPALLLAKKTMQQCNQFADKMDMEDLTREAPTNMAAYVSSITNEMETLLSRISLTINALNLALS
eukprot:CAMPEP_0118952262 /NCGR_PEP_ID=MMETSP1169-20130426/54554_1 /TAXON_ID=36882 /ORGANISM="Pyramimonas obovata, Strain CCMP722" /LENGTH=135 /DNA_ID=CAMNT_0006899469 /DNA_START=122 /DNA_END=525 /DNA_ORIENTATION=-